MEQITHTLLADVDALKARALILLMDFMRAPLAALKREMRALQIRVRVWLHMLASQTRDPVRSSGGREPDPDWYIAMRREERARQHRVPRKAAAPQAREAFGVSLYFSKGGGTSSPRTPNTERAARTAPDDMDGEIQLLTLINQLITLRETIADPARAIAALMRRASRPETKSAPRQPRAASAPSIKLQANNPYTDDLVQTPQSRRHFPKRE